MLRRAFSNKILVLCVIQMHFIECNTKLSEVLNETRSHRQKRTLYFTFYGGYALDVLLSLPLDLPANNNAFCAFVFSANFYYPSFDYVNGLIPIPFAYIDEPGVNAGSKNRIELPPAYRKFSDDNVGKRVHSENDNTNSANTSTFKGNEGKSSKNKMKEGKSKKNSKKIRSLLNNYFMSRRRFYKMLETKMQSSGLSGNDCLLKAICETSVASFGYNNGVIGSVIDVLFLPSASKDEKLPKKYYRAEANGKTGSCASYSKACPKSIFEFVSQII
ncbi:uncharacterized protein LOC119080769 [Bradysia coprophila]|uniref:uncharacterized protein LOC119080769 n=1 Tax=Bradysia coprophila TaxID=38358 RepID=UPI00187DA7A8|nr:uncharacterized protein LOC119080769 [Bradysia coprophila]